MQLVEDRRLNRCWERFLETSKEEEGNRNVDVKICP